MSELGPQQLQAEPDDSEDQDLQDEELAQDGSGRTIVVDPNPMNEIMKRAEQLRSETSDGVVFPCEYCQKVFKFKYEYERHAKIHSGDRPWQCPECMKTFSRKDNMRAHMKIHSGELVRHICQLCGKSYGRKYDLQVHERVHTGERPFECGSCGKSFISTSRLRAHQLIHCKNIYLPRHVRNKKLHLMKRVGSGRRGGVDSDSPTDSVDGCSPAAGPDDEEDDFEEDELDGEDEDDGEDTTDSQESAAERVSIGGGRQQPQQQQERVRQQQQQQQQLVLVQQKSRLQHPRKQQPQQPQQQQQQRRPSINLMTNPSRHISISLVKSCRQTVAKAKAAAADNFMDDPLCSDSPEVPNSAEIENRLQLLEAALMQRKAELAHRGIKVEVDGLLGLQGGDFNHTDFHVVLPTDACKDEPAG